MAGVSSPCAHLLRRDRGSHVARPIGRASRVWRRSMHAPVNILLLRHNWRPSKGGQLQLEVGGELDRRLVQDHAALRNFAFGLQSTNGLTGVLHSSLGDVRKPLLGFIEERQVDTLPF